MPGNTRLDINTAHWTPSRDKDDREQAEGPPRLRELEDGEATRPEPHCVNQAHPPSHWASSSRKGCRSNPTSTTTPPQAVGLAPDMLPPLASM